MDSFLSRLYRNTYHQYRKYRRRLDKSLHSGQFYRYTRKKQRGLINRIERLKRRLQSLSLQLKLGGAGIAFSLMLDAGSVDAQELGPFVKNDQKNPFYQAEIAGTYKKLTFADLDNDGDQDVAIGINTGVILYAENVGNADRPRFFQQTGAANPFNSITFDTYAAPELVDFDGDGDYDLIYAFQDYSPEVRYYQNSDFEDDGIIGNGPSFTLLAGASSPIQNVMGSYPSVKSTTGDLDGDGDLDILLGHDGGFPGYNTFTYYINNAGFSAAPVPSGLPNFDPGGQDYAPTFFDLDGDTDLDVVVGLSNGQIRYFENDDFDMDGVLGTPNFSELIGPGTNPFDGIDVGSNAVISFVDIDNDGDIDAFIGDSGFYGIAFLENIGGGVFVEITDFRNPFNGFDLGEDTFPTFADIDGDGHQDAIVGEKYDATLYYFKNMADGTVQELTGTNNPFDNLVSTGNADSHYPRFVDINNDTHLDVLVGLRDRQPNPDVGQISFYSNDGSDAFTFNSVLAADNTISWLLSAFADLDGDGDFDAVVGFDYTGTLRYYRNQDFELDGLLGTPSLVLETGASDPFSGIIISPTPALRPELADVDHDGDFDVVLGLDGGPYTGEIRYLQNDSFTFTELAGAANPFNGLSAGNDSAPAMVDWDEDGDLDLFVGEAYGGIEFFENQNLPPQTNSNTPNNAFTEDDVPLEIDPVIALSDDTNDLMIQATISIVGNYRNGEDVINVTLLGGATGSFDVPSGVYTISGTGTMAEYQAMLQSATYANASQNPDTSPRTIEFVVTDFDNTDPFSDAFPEAQTVISITSVNDVPVVTTTASGSTTYTENAAPVMIDPGVTASDIDHPNLVGATVSITSNFVAAEDVLLFTNQNGITGSYNAGSGVLTLLGVASVADYQTALQSITYQNSSENPSTASRTISFLVDDGIDPSNIDTRSVNVAAVNDAPAISSPQSPVNFVGVPLVIDNTLSLADIDHPNLVGATVQISAGTLVSSEDQILFTNQNGITGSYDAGTGILTLSGSATVANYQTALRSIQYNNSSGTPNTTTRVIQFTVDDGVDVSNTTSVSVIIGTNQPPVLSSSSAGVTYSGTAVVIDPTAVVGDPDDANLAGAVVRISVSTFVSGQDLLLFTNQNGITGSYDPGTGILTLSGSATVANYQTALRSIQYNNSSGTPSTTTRVIQFTVDDGVDVSNTISTSVAISVVTGSPPVITATTTDVNTGSVATVALPPLITDPDGDADLSTLSITQTPASGSPASINASDALVVDYSAGTFVGSETVMIQVCDAASNCAQQTFTFNVANTAPSLSSSGQSASFNGSLVVDLATLASDAEGNIDPAAFNIIQNPTSGASASLAGSTLTINYAGTNFAGNDAITVEACDLAGACTTAVITINIANGAPSITINTQSTVVNGSVTVNLSAVISDPDNNLDPGSFQVVSQPISGALATIAGGVLTIDYTNISFAGTDMLTIEACDLAGACVQQVVTIEVEGDIIVNNAISPNGDGKNDTWIITNITSLGPDNKVTIFSRWGDQVFEMEDYNNTTKVFTGLNNNGKELANGTYFYRIEFGDGRTPLTGYLLIKR